MQRAQKAYIIEVSLFEFVALMTKKKSLTTLTSNNVIKLFLITIYTQVK